MVAENRAAQLDIAARAALTEPGTPITETRDALAGLAAGPVSATPPAPSPRREASSAFAATHAGRYLMGLDTMLEVGEVE
jgi:hypothetical protein